MTHGTGAGRTSISSGRRGFCLLAHLIVVRKGGGIYGWQLVKHCFRPCWNTSFAVGVPTFAGVTAFACVHALAFVPVVTGVLAIAGVPAVNGVPSVAGVHAIAPQMHFRHLLFG
jgi:hypothetical protein